MKHQEHHIEETSLIAWNEIQGTLGERQRIVLNALYELTRIYGDATDYEITSYLSKPDPNYVRPRRHELVNKYKLICFSQQRICRVTGKKSMAWKPIRYNLEINKEK